MTTTSTSTTYTGSGVEPAVADGLGFISSRADWLATVLVVGLGPLLLSRDTWVPRWLKGPGPFAGAVSVLTLIAMYTGGLSTYGAAIVPVGIVWTLGAALVAIRQTNSGQPPRERKRHGDRPDCNHPLSTRHTL